jgi:uncharacterized protein (DUF1697 family)
MRAMKWVALLRGINVGGKNLVPMKALAALFEKAGARDVSTYIASGNVIFGGTPALAKKIPSLMHKMIPAQFGCESPVVIRSHDELGAISRACPFSDDDDERRVLVMFLQDSPKNVARLDPRRSPPDQFAVRGREVYLHCPNGYGRSKLTNDYFDRTLGTVSTVRNWRTVLKLLELTS